MTQKIWDVSVTESFGLGVFDSFRHLQRGLANIYQHPHIVKSKQIPGFIRVVPVESGHMILTGDEFGGSVKLHGWRGSMILMDDGLWDGWCGYDEPVT